MNEEFLEAAFDNNQQNQLVETSLKNKSNREHETDGGRNTTDKVFLLSIDEAEEYLSSEDEKLCKPTEYVVAQNVSVVDNGICWWWLRSYRSDEGEAACGSDDVGDDVFSYYGYSDINLPNAVRPAMWINIE